MTKKNFELEAAKALVKHEGLLVAMAGVVADMAKLVNQHMQKCGVCHNEPATVCKKTDASRLACDRCAATFSVAKMHADNLPETEALSAWRDLQNAPEIRRTREYVCLLEQRSNEFTGDEH